MAGTKQTFKYRDPRETRLLNQASKDQYGRQRNHVLYGFDWGPSGTNRNQILLGRGAIYTQDGVKIFFDDTALLSTLIPSQGLTNGLTDQFPFPKNIIIGIQHNYVASATAQDAKLVMIEVRTAQGDQEPAYYLQEINTITLVPMSSELVDPDRKAYNGLYDMNIGGGSPATSTNVALHKTDNSILNNVTPILKVRIQQIHNGGTAVTPAYLFTSTGALTEGVEIVRYKNAWQQVNDLIGLNVFEPLIESDQNAIGDLHYPTSSRHSQAFVKNISTGGSLPTNEMHTPTQHPLFGSFDPNGPTNYADYRFASFLMDGRSILEGMKRLDSWIRLLVNRTGEDSLVDLTDSLTELKQVVDQGLTGDPIVYGANFMLQDGNIFHDGTANTGDSHRRALHFLDNAVSYICNRLGMTPLMTRGEIASDSLTATELWDVSNPPGLDITSAMTFHEALQTLRNYFTSRGNDVITGRHIYSLTDSDRIQGGDPVGQKVIVNNNQVKVTNDTAYIDITDGSLDSSDARSDKIAGVEVATLDGTSRYKVNIIASHDAARIANNQGPLLQGVVNATQGKSLLGALENVLDYNPQWNIDQLQRWAGKNSVVHDTVDGGLILSGAALRANELTPDPFIVCKGIVLDWYYDLNNLVMASAGPFVLTLRFYDGSFAHIINRDVQIASYAANQVMVYSNGSIVDGVIVGTNKPAAAVYYKIVIDYAGSGVCSFKLRFGCDVSNSPILVNTPTGSDPRTLTRRDFVDAALALKQDNLVYDGTVYTLVDGHAYVGNSLRVVVGGVTKYIPSSNNPFGSCHSDCHPHSNHSHNDCGRYNAW